MKKEVNPKETTRAHAFELWMKAPNPMVTFFKTINVTRLVNVCKRKNMKFNMLLDYCIGRAAASIKEFYLLSVSPHPDGWCPCRALLGHIAEGNYLRRARMEQRILARLLL